MRRQMYSAFSHIPVESILIWKIGHKMVADIQLFAKGSGQRPFNLVNQIFVFGAYMKEFHRKCYHIKSVNSVFELFLIES